MNSKQFLEHFVPKNKSKIVLGTQYVIISRRIKSMKNRKSVVTANFLYPNNSILSEYTVDSDSDAFFDAYIDQLSDNIPFLATLIKGVIKDKYNIVFMCTKAEEKLGYFDALRYFIESTFKFPIYTYKKDKIEKSKYDKYDKKKILKKCNKILKNAQKSQLDRMESCIEGRRKLASKMSKKEMIKKLKEIGVVGIGSMSKEEMKEYLEEFYVYE